MSYGAGHVIDMINRMKQNRAQRPSKRAKFKEHNRDGIYSLEEESEQPNFKTVPKEVLDAIKSEIRERSMAKRKQELIIYGVLIALVVVVSIIILVLLD